MIFALARRLAWSRDPRQLWRQLSVIVATTVAAFLGVVGCGVVTAAQHADGVREARQPVFARSAGESAMLAMSDALVVDGVQVPLIWIEPVPGAPGRPVVPPGLTSFPPPGSVVVSPGLAQRGVDAARLGMVPASVGSGEGGTIGPDGLATASEPFAYAVPRQGASLARSSFAEPTRGYGGSAPAEDRMPVEASEFMISGSVAALLVGWLIGLPALFALVAVARSYSELKERRVAFLHRQGVSMWGLRMLSAVEGAALAGPGAAVGAAIGFVVAPRVGNVPGSATTLWPGSAAVPWPVATSIALLVFAVVVGAAVLGPLRRRPLRRAGRARITHLVPLALGLAFMFGSVLLPRDPAARAVPLLLGLGLMTIGVPMAVPVLTRWLGRRMARAEAAGVWLVGRRLEARAGTLARPASAGAALVFVAVAAEEGARSSEPTHWAT